MKKEQALELMNSIPADLVEEIDIAQPARRHLPRAVRAGLMAACLCLALLGTAVAAAPEAITALIELLMVNIVFHEEGSGYTIQSDMIRYPLSAFSPALLAASEGRETSVVSLTFDTWDEVQAFLGDDIPCVWPGGGDDWDTGWFQVLLFHTEREALWGIQVYSVDLSRQAQVYVDIRTEHWLSSNDEIASLMDVPETEIEDMGGYPMTGGPVAEVVVRTGIPDSDHISQCNAHGLFVNSGILYQVETFGSLSTREETVSRLYTILDSFSFP